MATENNIQKPVTVGDLLRAYQSGIAPQEEIDTEQQGQQQAIPNYASQVRRDLSGGVTQTYTSEALQSGYGTSRFDTRYQPERDIEDSRAEAQSGFGKIANGVAKGGVTAVATAANTIAGLPYGFAIRGMFELATGLIGDDDKRNFVDAAVNNEIAQLTQRMQDLSEKLFPNYKTNEERSEEYQRHFIRHTLTPNFIGDDFIKNFGFTIGAIIGGSVASRGINKLLYRNLSKDIMKGAIVASNGDSEASAEMQHVADAIKRGNLTRVEGETLVANMKDIGKRLNKANTYSQLIGAGVAAAGEGTFEGINIRKEFLDEIRRDAGEQLQEDYIKAYDDIIAENNPDYVIENGGIVNDGAGSYNIPVLNGAGQEELLRRQQELTANYEKMMAYADTQGERLASLTFALNLPILTASNAYQFGRMLSGGWKTARRSASLSGGIRNGAVPTADYKPRDSVASRTIFKSLGLAGSEAAEEMSQGFVSSGFKKGAQMRLATFTNDGYDAEQISKLESWFTGLGRGGMDYLSDIKNWKEGWLGALTGMLGIPGRTWNGGVIEAHREAREEYDIDRRLAEKLNQTVNSEDFDSRLRGWVRHMKYDDDMSKAVSNNDEYAWHTADDRQLISDIVMFADADRLDDYLDTVNSYKTVTEQDMKQLKGSLAWANNMSDEDVQKKINEQAEKIVDKIEEYKEIYEAMQARIPLGASKPYLNELVATAMEINAYEKRFMNLFGEVFNMIDPTLKSMAEKDSKGNKYTGEELEKRLSNIRARYERRMNSRIPEEDMSESAKEERSVFDALLDIAVGQKRNIREKIDDLKKLQDARALYFKKLQTLEGTNGQQRYEEQAATPEIVQAAAEAEYVQEKTQNYTSVKDIQEEYKGIKEFNKKNDFVDMLAHDKSGNKHIKEFLNMVREHRKLVKYLEAHKSELGSFSWASRLISNTVKDAIYKADSLAELMSFPDRLFPSYEDFVLELSRHTIRPIIDENLYNTFKKDTRDAINRFARGTAHTASKDTAKPNPNPAPSNPASTETPEGYDASNPASATPLPTATGTPQPQPEPVEEPEPEDKQPAEQTGLTTVNNPTGSDTVDDAFFAGQAAETPQSEIIDSEPRYSTKAYYRTSVPEIATGEAEKARDAIKTGEREDLKKADLSDFVDSHPQFADVWNAFNKEGAFKAIAMDLKVGDRIELIIDPSFPQYEGKPQILMAKRKDDGTYQILTPLLTKTSMYQGLAELREDINEEYDSFIKQHPGELFVFSKSTTVIAKRPGLIEYDFNKDADKPIKDIRGYEDVKSKARYIFVDGAGQLRLVGDYKAEGTEIPKRLKDMFDSKSDEARRNMKGNFYLIVPSGDSYAKTEQDKQQSWIPIRLGFEHFKKGNIEGSAYLTDIRDIVRELEDIIRNTTPDNIDDVTEEVQKVDENGKPVFIGETDEEGNPVMEDYEDTEDGEVKKKQRQVQIPATETVPKKKGQRTLMREKLQQIGDVLDIHNLYFELSVYDNVGPAVRIIQNRLDDEHKQKLIENGEEVPEEKELTMRRPEQMHQDFLTELFSNINEGKGLSVQVRFDNDKNGGRTYVSTETLDEMIDAGVVTSNAKMLRPKGVDFYTLPYSKRSHDFYEATPWQTQAMEVIKKNHAYEIAERMNATQEQAQDKTQPALEDDTDSEAGYFFEMRPIDDIPTYASDSEARLRDGLTQKMRDSGIDVELVNGKEIGYTDEMRSIKTKAIADGTFMKAPNGKPTNLTERQWLQVRTKAFKNWFGDWEHIAEYEGVKILPVEYEESGDENYPFMQKSGFRIEYEGNIVGVIPFNKKGEIKVYDGETITEIFPNYRNKGIATKAYIASAAYLAKQGIALTSDTLLTDDAVRLWESLVKKGYAEKIMDTGNKDRYGYNEKQYKFVIDKVRDIDIHPNSSKVVDENGEPLVVYSGRPYKGITNFTKTLKSHRNRTNLTGILKKGIYFASDKHVAKMYEGSYDIKNPLDKELAKYGAGEDGSIFLDKNEFLSFHKDVSEEHYNELLNRYKYVKNDENNPTGEFYAERAKVEGETIEAFLNIKNPIILDNKRQSIAHLSKENINNINDSEGAIIKNVDENVGIYEIDMVTNDYIVFEPNQIKSATDNVGTFSGENADINMMRDSGGDIYGYTQNGKIYLNSDKISADAPIHEYTHLWANAMRKNNPSEWNNIRSIMEKETELWQKVQAKYPELHGDDLAAEVLAHYSGRRGAERLRAELSGSTDEGLVSRAFKVVTDALDRFWKAVADMLGIHFTKAEDIADAVLSDLLNGVNPNDELSWTNDPTDSRFWVVRSENDLRRVIRGTSMTDSITPMVAYRYSELPEDIREMLDIHGYTDENYNHMPDLLKDRVLRCAGV